MQAGPAMLVHYGAAGPRYRRSDFGRLILLFMFPRNPILSPGIYPLYYPPDILFDLIITAAAIGLQLNDDLVCVRLSRLREAGQHDLRGHVLRELGLGVFSASW